MSFKVFKNNVNSWVFQAGIKAPVRFSSHDGNHEARCAGVRITGNETSRVFTVRWGSGHKAIVPVC